MVESIAKTAALFWRLIVTVRSHMDMRVLLAQDAAAFQGLRLQALSECPTAFSSSYEEECDRPLFRVGERLASTAGHAVFGAFDGNKLIGIVGIHREEHRKLAHKAFIWGMYVAPAYRNRGLGRQLLDRALTHAATMPGLRQVNLGVNAENSRAIALYEAADFRRFGVERGFLLVDGVLYDEIQMAVVITKPQQLVAATAV
jgi:RimJ/RimL family protein N-acetyltransferase